MPRSSARSLSQLPHLAETWLVAIAQARIWITPPNEMPYHPYLILIINENSGMLRGTEIAPTSPDPKQVWEALVPAMRQPLPSSGRRGAPRTIAVADHTLADALRLFVAEAQLTTSVLEQELPSQVFDIIRDFEFHSRRARTQSGDSQGDRPELPGLLDVPGVASETLRDFYAGAAEFYRAAPWTQLSNAQIIAVRLSSEREYRYVIVMGQAGVEYGMVVHQRWSDVVRMFTEDDNPMDMQIEGGWRSLFFDDASVVPFDDLDTIEKFGFEITAPNAFPIPIVIESRGHARRPSREEIIWYQAALRAVPCVVRDHLKSDGRGDYKPFEATIEVATHTGMVSVVVKYPAGELPLADQPATRLDWSDPEQSSSEPPAFDRRRMEKMMSPLVQALGEEGRDPNLERAQDLMYDAFDEDNPAKRIALAHDALAMSPNCADAYVVLAEDEADTVKKALEYYEEGIAAGERALGEDYITMATGNFWGILETRPYMRAKRGLADSLRSLGRKEEAVTAYRELLRLNPGDNQGNRYMLVDLLLELARDKEVEQLLKEYGNEPTAVWRYTKALLEFRRNGPSTRANRTLAQALQHNPHVPAYLTARRRIPNHLPDVIGFGDEREAVAYAADHLNHWRRTLGAVDWVREQSSIAERRGPRKRKPL